MWKVLLNKSLYTAHVQTEHIGNKYVYKCHVCNKTFNRRILLKGHLISIHTRPFPNCGKMNIEKQPWSESMKNTDLRVFTCTDCKEAYTISSKLTKQTKLGGGMKRAAENLYTCTECSRLFVKRTDCEGHQSVHMTTKPFICHICRISFTKSANLKAHFRDNHPLGEKNSTK